MVGNKLKTGAIVQARLGSERLPGKALLPLPFSGGPAILEHVVQRAMQAKCITAVLVATTNTPQDDALFAFCQSKGIVSFRGEAEDVLSRFYKAAEAHHLDIIVRLTGDNPCIFPEVIDQAVAEHLQTGADYTRTEGLPLGTNIEVISFTALAKAQAATQEPGDREHVTPYFYLTGQHLFKNHRLHLSSSVAAAVRLTIDYPSDYALLSLVFSKLYTSGPAFGLDVLEELFRTAPWLAAVNSSNQQRKVNLSEREELMEAAKLLQQAGLSHAAALIQNKL